ncbi:hypothetical protein C8J57DRAFT_627192 [Mycena rebaudengoi]|nr:hypothetical protein C8J57DRAFT_627192 [Mycena rebaudengoi]
MRVPQEIVDKESSTTSPILSDTGRPLDFTPTTLLCCDLLSQPPKLTKFDRLLAESPQIGELYVRHLTLILYPKGESPRRHVMEAQEILRRILLLLPNLTHVGVDAMSRVYKFRVTDRNEGVIQKMFSFRSLRGVCLTDLEFADVWELELLLSHATGLKELILLSRCPLPLASHCLRPCLHECCVVLESVRLESMAYALDLIAANFTIVDVRHLHYLEVIGAPLVPLLTTSAQTNNSGSPQCQFTC